MKSPNHKNNTSFFWKLYTHQGIWFHIFGIIAIIWFLLRVIPKPDRIRYPCQQMSIMVASSYVVFWIILWSALFHGFALWIKRVKLKTVAFTPVILTGLIVLFSVSSIVYADINNNENNEISIWEPTPNEPLGIPQGVNPGRVVWVWDPNATESTLQSYWWLKENNNQIVIDEMFSKGIQGLAGTENDEDAWDRVFSHFNQIHGYGDINYQAGEKIAIKVNLNNCWERFSYIKQDNDRDASPYIVKALLRQLVNIVGVAQEDITVYDASRKMPNWFYHRVYYETYPAEELIPEFPGIHYVDAVGGLSGREKVVASTERIYFADTGGLVRTLPICVTDAKYIINMPLLKRHPIQNGVTLSGKNFFGTWIESVEDVHDYHTAAFSLGNPAPQTDLLAHKHIGGKTILYIGDGIFATKEDHCTICKFQMYPFNNDWTNSLFFSQDPVAVDSVMYDFLHAEGTNPCEGSQNYLHQSAEPPSGIYDPENDGVYVTESLGVHEHWNKTVDVFSSQRYSGLLGNGIDFVVYGADQAHPAIIITKPKENFLYINGVEKTVLPATIVIGDIDVEVRINGVSEVVEKVEFYVDEQIIFTDYAEPYTWYWDTVSFSRHTLQTVAYYQDGKNMNHSLMIWKLF